MSGEINKGINEYCEQVINLLFNKGSCTIKDIQDYLKKKRRTAYNVVSFLTGAGVIYKDNDKYRLIDKDKIINPDSSNQYELSDKEIIEAWLILSIMYNDNIHRIKDPDYPSIVPRYDHKFGDSYPLYEQKIRKYINYLIEKKYIVTQILERNKFDLHIPEYAPVLTCLNKKDAKKTFSEYYLNNIHLKDEVDVLEEIARKLTLIIPDYSVKSSSRHISSGRFNKINNDTKKILNHFLKLNFKKKVIEIKYLDAAGNILKTNLKTGLLVYSVEKNSFYVFGITEKKERIIIRLDSIINAKETNKLSTIEYRNKEFVDIFERMYSISIEEPEPVEILFKDEPYIRTKIEALCELRGETSKIEKTKNIKGWFLYKDEIAGFNDFLPYIRSFGSSAIIKKPVFERNNTINKTEEIIEKYEEILHG